MRIGLWLIRPDLLTSDLFIFEFLFFLFLLIKLVEPDTHTRFYPLQLDFLTFLRFLRSSNFFNLSSRVFLFGSGWWWWWWQWWVCGRCFCLFSVLTFHFTILIPFQFSRVVQFLLLSWHFFCHHHLYRQMWW